MSIRIAVAGKGGTGKTTFVALLIKELLKNNQYPILAIDADPNSNLNEHLGIEYEETISKIREEIRDEKNIPQSMSKPEYINYRLTQSITESNGIDLLVMGAPEGKGCYCYVNELLRNFLSNLSKDYRFVIIDNAAGMEHLSRTTTDNIDILFIIINPDRVSITAGKKIYKLAKELKLNIKKIYFIINRANNTDYSELITEFNKDGLEIAGFLPEADELKYIPIPENTAVNIDIKKLIDNFIFIK
jgi:CO dehydrogenase maturation factor